MNTRKSIRIATIAALAALIGACSGGSDSNNGNISVSMMDRSVDGVVELNITVTEFWIKPQGSGPAFQLDMVATPVTVNLLELTADNPAIFVERANIPAGTYNWLEMKVDDSNSSAAYAMTDDGAMLPVDIDVPSDRVRLINNFVVEPNDSVRFLFDWDVRKGLTEAVGRSLYILKPVIRVLDVEEFGSIVGAISSATVIADENGCNADSATADYDIGNALSMMSTRPWKRNTWTVTAITNIEQRLCPARTRSRRPAREAMIQTVMTGSTLRPSSSPPCQAIAS